MIRFARTTCDFCGVCVGVCPVDAISLFRAELLIDHAKCISCNFCVDVCPSRSLHGEEEKDTRAENRPGVSP
ncbi:MAG TPA: 4Fe-4S binding protein [Candidatus Latescibacteria bacterium]|nr:4Fe-4S binding protein [Candidatus Latescibacterota bacterium]HQI75329.1 4Fe-4S binding protein [Candidatus Latescibacterota bacterium]HQK21617.1 4Fe-4S binding protein [Candidatus Latescibacterota bacterium]